MDLINSQFTIRFAPNCIDADKVSPDDKAKRVAKGLIPAISTILLDRVRVQINADITKHQLYYASPGIGKSTVARVRLLDPKYSSLYVNCSKERGIDELRTRIENFCTQSAISESGIKQTKVVFLDEVDGVTAVFADGLRGFMDTYEAMGVKFLATANHITRVPAAIQSRFNPCINFAPLDDKERDELFEKYKKRLKAIWTGPIAQGMLGRQATEEAIHKLATKTQPDIRSGLQSLQTLHETVVGELTVDNLVTGMTSFKELYDFILKAGVSDQDIHKEFSIKYADKGFQILSSMHEQLVDYIIEKYPTHIKLIGAINILSAKYLQMFMQGIDPLVCTKACFSELVQLSNKIQA